ncbi:uncharacterized protein LOC18014146 isoform X2 [Eutrema salsugineum]|uniref:uncharacterized protein LOC18014146 isoform X2 n=1 Tax=Eutrema salsugineum TaxID=72664 RepID=UPI000CED11AD|nr:uncharacterized protein LOC18014146 isoform X2 [Eutrema salsugineum]
MASGDRTNQPLSPPTPIVQPTTPTKRVLITSLLAGGGVGLVSKHRKAYPNIPTIYATNFAIVAGCYCGAREFVRITRRSEHEDLMSSAIGGLFSGALLGRLQGGPHGAFRYSVIFAAMGTACDYAALRAKPMLESFRDMDSIKLPEWSPIQILDEEALAKKQEEQRIFAERSFGRLNKEEA